jgi:very-short-patch-repair endonuclease
LAAALNQGAHIVETSAKSKVRVKTGRLKGSIHVINATPERLESQVIADTSYACVFNAQTTVVTANGQRTIGQIKEGDRVLTQTGEYKRIIATNRFLAELKPELITITTAHNKGGTHKLTVTTDHKILTHRDGRNQWIHAGDLTLTDSLYTKIKIAHNKGTAPIKTCINCGTDYHYRRGYDGSGQFFCSRDCQYKYLRGLHGTHFGKKHSTETRAQMSDIKIKQNREHPEKHINCVRTRRGFNTNIECEVEEWIKKSGKRYQKQHRIGGCYVDFYLPDDRAVIEADGAFWHQDQEKDISRDEEIKRAAPDTTILHIHFYNKRYSQNLIPNPLKEVYYVACNPGMSSFVDPTVFKLTPILKLEPWTYKDKRKSKRGAKHSLYDLTIEDVHSFYANGILVSNSYVEKGTQPHVIVPVSGQVLHFTVQSGDEVFAQSVQSPGSQAYPFMEPALTEHTEDIKASILLALQMEMMKL